MTETFLPLDSVLTWKDVGMGQPAGDLLVPPDNTGLPRITPNVHWEGRLFHIVTSRTYTSWTSVALIASDGSQLFTFAFIRPGATPGRTFLVIQLATITRVQTGSIAATPFASLPTVGWAVGPGLPIPPNVIAAEDSLSSGAAFPPGYGTPNTVELSFGDHRVQFGLLSQSKVAQFNGILGAACLVFETRATIAEDDAIRLAAIEAGLSVKASFKTLPLYWGQQSEGNFTARRLYARRDDSQVETVDYSVDSDGNTQAEVQRVTSFVVRRDSVPPMTALLSEYDVWNGSRPVWRIETVELLDRAATARLNCSEFVVA